ncbi:hypothetical protein Ate02nite_12100 [Paractinoplanes tereljensis]|uniref:Uncharacterized protein n=1 Tax=Paractinoplanes tereljensis TaxID=571912 RepID=A0A919NI06_9ACTN|nr:hypothetical protein Ate02nite_12100 [Actinoplanes tereljensis]
MPDGVEHARHVVVEETADMRRAAGPLPGLILDPGERAGQAGRHHQHEPRGRGDLKPDQPRPPPRDEAAEYAQGQKREMRDHCGVRDGFPHDIHGTAAVTPGRWGDSRRIRYGALNPRVYAPEPEVATTTYR